MSIGHLMTCHKIYLTISLQIYRIFQCKYSMLCHHECKVVKPDKLKAKIYAMAMSVQEAL